LLQTVSIFNLSLFILFTLIYFYRNIYVLISLYWKRKPKKDIIFNNYHRYAVLIAARNESKVINELLDSIKNQNYPKDLIDIYIVADNFTDDTADIARESGAYVYERNNMSYVGKGYALNFLFNKLLKQRKLENYDGYFVFDADNILDKNYINQMNKYFDNGYKVLTSYRNSKNYGSNWISAGYALWFLYEAEYLNKPRMILKTSCAISGTGFLIHKDIIKKNNGWNYFLLTEDIEFSISEVIKGEKIGYCDTAILYDEQPTTFKQSWNQRLRWAKGFYQVFRYYGADILKCSFSRKKHSFSCYDMMMTIMPALLITISSTILNTIFLIYGLLKPIGGHAIVNKTLSSISSTFILYYAILFILGLITTITEWNNIYCSNIKKIIYLFTFPVFMFTYIPIALVALFKKVEWSPIEHNSMSALKSSIKI